MTKKLINCDLGECLTPNPDAEVMPLIDMANIACGGHVGDDESINQTIRLAKENNVTIGAHPAYEDRENFGRLSINISSDDLYNSIVKQVRLFQDLCNNNNTKLEYIKPHGALYHDMMYKTDVMQVLLDVIKAVDPNLKLVVQAGFEPYLKNFEKNANGLFLREVFADRAYQGLTMISRKEKGAVLDNAEAIVSQYQRFLSEKSFKIDTICFHGDNNASVKALEMLKNA